MELQIAREIINVLAQGIHPVTGEMMPPDSPYNEPPVIRALFSIGTNSTPSSVVHATRRPSAEAATVHAMRLRWIVWGAVKEIWSPRSRATDSPVSTPQQPSPICCFCTFTHSVYFCGMPAGGTTERFGVGIGRHRGSPPRPTARPAERHG